MDNKKKKIDDLNQPENSDVLKNADLKEAEKTSVEETSVKKTSVLKENSKTEMPAAEEKAETEQESTVFAKSAIVTKKPKKKKKALVLICAAIAAVVLALGVCTVVWLLPESKKEIEDKKSTTISVLANSANNISKIVFKNANGTFTINSYKKASESSNSNNSNSSESGTNVAWKLEGYDEKIIADSYLSAMADSAASLNADRQMTDTTLNYGFDNPLATVSVTGKNGLKDYSITVGNLCPDGTGYYIKTSAKDGIFLVTPSTVKYFCLPAEELVNNSIIEAVDVESLDKSYITDDNTLDHIDSLTLSGKNYPKTIKIDYTGKSLAAYRMSTPISRYADAEAVEQFVNIVKGGLVASNAYKISPSANDIAKYGLNNPDVILNINLSGKTTKIKATLQKAEENTAENTEEGTTQYYALMLNDVNVIYKVSKDNLTCFDLKQEEFYNRFAFLENYEDISNMTFTTDNKSHSFDISYNSEKNTTSVKYNGKKAEDSLLRTYFSYYTTLKPDVQSTYPTGKEAFRAAFKFRNSNKTTVIKFISINDRRYIVNINGNNEGVINYTVFDNIKEYLNNVINKKEIPEAA